MVCKVCIFTSTHSPFDTRIFYKQARSLVEAGYQVTIIAPHSRIEIQDGVRIKSVPVIKSKLKRILFLPFRFYSMAVKEQADVYHFHDPDLLLIAYLLKLRMNSKIVYDVHEDYPEVIKSRVWIPRFLRPLLSFLFERLEKLVSNKFDGIITVTDEIRLKFPPKKTIVVRNYPLTAQGVDTDSFRENGIDHTEFQLIYVGDITRVRGIVEIVRALEFLKDHVSIRLKVIGGFSEQGLEEEIKELAVYGLVDFLGRQLYASVPGYLSAADVGLVCLHPLVRYQEALPVKMFEYMAAGLPVIASNFPRWERIINYCECGLVVNPLNPREIAESVRYLIEHPQERLKMGRNGIKAVQEKYNWEAEAWKMLQMYQEFIEN